MSNNTNLLNRSIFTLVFAGLLMMAAAPSVAHAQSNTAWMATSAHEAPLAGRGFGRLSIDDGVLAFASRNFAWQLPLSDIKRVSASKTVANALEIESFSGQRYLVGVLTAQLTANSPSKAVQTIERAVRTAPAPLESRPTMVAAGGGPF